jgi:hypothetical protein
MTPDTTPYRPEMAPTTCADCSGLLGGQRWRCAARQRAAEIAVQRRQPGQVVRPSDVAAAREERDVP